MPERKKGRTLGLIACFGLMVNAAPIKGFATLQSSQNQGANSAQNAKASASPTGTKSATGETTDSSRRPKNENIEVESVTFAVGISSKMPVGASDSFDSAVGGLYFWSRLRVQQTPTQIKYSWYHDNEKMGEYTISVRYRHTRLWTYRAVQPGLWRVEIADDAGNTITVATCIVRNSSKLKNQSQPSKSKDPLQPSAQ